MDRAYDENISKIQTETVHEMCIHGWGLCWKSFEIAYNIK